MVIGFIMGIEDFIKQLGNLDDSAIRKARRKRRERKEKGGKPSNSRAPSVKTSFRQSTTPARHKTTRIQDLKHAPDGPVDDEFSIAFHSEKADRFFSVSYDKILRAIERALSLIHI